MGTTLAITIGSLVFAVVVTVIALRAAGIGGPRKKVLASGVSGQATILGVTPTGTVINEINYVVKFQLRVQVPGRAQYDVETKETLPITAMGAIVPGTVVSVKVDHADPAKVFIDWQGGVQPGGAAAAAAPGMPPSTGDLAAALHDPSVAASIAQGTAADLLRTGQPAQGYLKSFSDTGQTPRMLGRNVAPDALDDPLFVLEVELHFSAGMAPIDGTVVHRVPRAIAPTLRVGMPLRCAVDPANPTRRFAVDWAAVSAAPMNG